MLELRGLVRLSLLSALLMGCATAGTGDGGDSSMNESVSTSASTSTSSAGGSETIGSTSSAGGDSSNGSGSTGSGSATSAGTGGGAGGSGGGPAAACGDGVVDAGEECDDGANNGDTKACTSMCKAAACGDGLVQAGVEQCDDGANNGDTKACTSTCDIAVCGDGLVQAGVEQCDDGANNDDTKACTSTCKVAVCGDGLVQAGVEQCDDGNLVDGDGCNGCKLGGDVVWASDDVNGKLWADVAVDAAGNIYTVGTRYFATDTDVIVRKADKNGNTLWEREHDQSGSDDFGNGITVDAAGNVYVAGSVSFTGFTDSDAWIAKYSSNGTLLWSAVHDGYGIDTGVFDYLDDNATGIGVDAGGNVYVAGTATFDVGDADALIAKYSSTGSLLADGVIASASDEFGNDLVIDGAGNLIVAGYQSPNGAFVIKATNTLNALWSRTYKGGANFEASAFSVAVDKNNNVLVTGWEQVDALGTNLDAWLRKYDPNGNALWTKTYGGVDLDVDIGYSVATDGVGNIVVGGSAFVQTDNDFLLAKYSSAGDTIWSNTYDSGVADNDYGRGVAVAADGIVLAGYQLSNNDTVLEAAWTFKVTP